MSFETLFESKKPLIGMIHLLPLPGSPRFNGTIDDIYVRALADAYALERAGIDALIVENYGDHPYSTQEPSAENLALMAAVTREVKLRCSIPVGINFHFNAWRSAVAIAYACEIQFMRVNVFVDTVVSLHGVIEPCAAQLMRYRKALGAVDVQIWADIQPHGTRNLLPQSLIQSAKDAATAGADAIIVTEQRSQLPLDEVTEIKQSIKAPVLVGTGVDATNVHQVLALADGAIVGKILKVDSDPENAVSVDSTAKFVKAARKAVTEDE